MDVMVGKKGIIINFVIDLLSATVFLVFAIFINVDGIGKLLYLLASVLFLITACVRIFSFIKKPLS